MSVSSDELLDAAKRLHGYLLKKHFDGNALVGPDSGIRFNARFGRFIKSYLRFLPWSDNLTYMQAQGYWVLDNWLMYDLLADERYCDYALSCSTYIASAQRSSGYWDYPNPAWKGRIATVEGCFACLGLLGSYSRVQHEPYLAGAKKWYEYLVNHIGFRAQADGRMLAANYFAHVQGHGGGVPNNSTLVLWNLACLADVTGNNSYLTNAAPMVAWLKHVQLDSGELPYALGASRNANRDHFLCYQYNAFEFMDMAHYFQITGDKEVWPVMERLAGFLSNGLESTGAARYDCSRTTPEVTYYTVAVARALSEATALGIGDYRSLCQRGWRKALSQQRANGGFEFYSKANFKLLADRRSYPRCLSMILNHLLHEFRSQPSASL
jgi:hypothetical protein